MKYEEYIELGFKRTDMNDNVEFRQTGYYGFSLERKINKKLLVVVNSGELDKPKLYIRKNTKLFDYPIYHIISINTEVVKDLIINNQ